MHLCVAGSMRVTVYSQSAYEWDPSSSTLGLDVPSCSAKGPLALECSLLNRVCSKHVCQTEHCCK